MRASNGTRVAGISLIENTLTRYPGIRQMQLVQDSIDHVQVNLVRGEQYGPDTEAAMRGILGQSLGEDIQVDILLVDQITQEKNGKYRFSICQV